MNMLIKKLIFTFDLAKKDFGLLNKSKAALILGRAPPPAAMQFMPQGGLETSIYNVSQRTNP